VPVLFVAKNNNNYTLFIMKIMNLYNFNSKASPLVYTKKAVAECCNSQNAFHKISILFQIPFLDGFLYAGRNPYLVDSADATCRNFKSDPTIFFRNEKSFLLDVGIKPPLGFNIRMRYMMSGDGLLTCYLTNT
jgi:hypothetical protein